MSRGKQGMKTGREERHKARERALRERKRLRKQRAAQYAHLPGQQGQQERQDRYEQEPKSLLESMTNPQLREACKSYGVKTRSRDKKAELIAKLDVFMGGR